MCKCDEVPFWFYSFKLWFGPFHILFFKIHFLSIVTSNVFSRVAVWMGKWCRPRERIWVSWNYYAYGRIDHVYLKTPPWLEIGNIVCYVCNKAQYFKDMPSKK